MKTIPADYRVTHTFIVGEHMTVDFEEPEAGLGKLHPVYATYWLGKHFELVSRKLTLPFLGPDEEGIGFELSVRHLAPTLPGMTIELQARLREVAGNRIYADCLAVNELGDLVGEGSTTQVILTRDELASRMAALRERWHVHRSV